MRMTIDGIFGAAGIPGAGSRSVLGRTFVR